MSIILQITRERQRISEQLGKMDAERSALQLRLDELNVAERVLSRLTQSGRAREGARPERARPKKPEADEAQILGAKELHGALHAGRSMPLGDAALQAVRAHPKGASSDAVRC